jgi:hypothetical protein
MASADVSGRIEVTDAVGANIIRPNERNVVASVVMIGKGGFGNVYKIYSKRESCNGSDNPLRVEAPSIISDLN